MASSIFSLIADAVQKVVHSLASLLGLAGDDAKKTCSPTTTAGGTTTACPLAAAKPQSLDEIAHAVNPLKGTNNCGNIIDADISRLDGSDPNATAPIDQDGTFEAIAQRHDTNFNWGNNLNDAYTQVQNGGDGTTAIVGIKYANSTASHVVVMANQGGTVGIIEGQDWGNGQTAGVITDPAQAAARYGADSDIGIAMLPKH